MMWIAIIWYVFGLILSIYCACLTSKNEEIEDAIYEFDHNSPQGKPVRTNALLLNFIVILIVSGTGPLMYLLIRSEKSDIRNNEIVLENLVTKA